MLFNAILFRTQLVSLFPISLGSVPMSFLTSATLGLTALSNYILLVLSAPSPSPVPLTFSYAYPGGHGNTNLTLLNGPYGYGMAERSEPAFISAYIDGDTTTMACPYPGRQAALVPADEGVTWNFVWVEEGDVASLPEGSRLDAFSVGGRATWADTTDDATVNTTVGCFWLIGAT